MQRRKFIATAAATIPAIAFGQALAAQETKTGKGFVVKAQESRFKESTVLFGGTSPNDIKVSSSDTAGNLTVFEYTGNVKGGPPLHIHLKQDEIFFIVEENEELYIKKLDILLKWVEIFTFSQKEILFFYPEKYPTLLLKPPKKEKCISCFSPQEKWRAILENWLNLKSSQRRKREQSYFRITI